jgi:hypothetical protein
MSFVERALSFVFQRQDGSTFSNGSNIITLPPGLMASVRVQFSGLPMSNAAQITIWGLTASIMNELNTLGVIYNLQPRNIVTVLAGESGGSNFGSAFTGGIRDAIPDFNRQPETPLSIQAFTALENGVAALPQSFTGSSDIALMLNGLAVQMKYQFQNSGVSGISLSNQYLWGSPRDQVKQIAAAVKSRGIMVDIVEGNPPTVALWYTAKGRGGIIPLITPQNGLIGYPSYTNFGIDFRCIYTPNLRQGGQVQVQSTLPGGQSSTPDLGSNPSANGLWNIFGLGHSLDSQIPRGLWETNVHATRVGYPAPVLPQA